MATVTTTRKGRLLSDLGLIACRVDFSKTAVNATDTYVLAAVPKGFVPRNVCVNVVQAAGAAGTVTPSIGGTALASAGTALATAGATGAASASEAMVGSDTTLTAEFSVAETAGVVDIIVSGDFMLGANDVGYVRDAYSGTGDPWPNYLKA